MDDEIKEAALCSLNDLQDPHDDILLASPPVTDKHWAVAAAHPTITCLMLEVLVVMQDTAVG